MCKKNWFRIMGVLLALAVIVSCSGGGGGGGTGGTGGGSDAATQVTAANTALANQDIASAMDHYQQALAADPTNKEANAGYAMTEGILLIDDPAVNDIITRWDTYMPTVQNIVYSAVTNSFQVWGGNTPYCGTDPANSGYTKLTTTSTAAPYTFDGSYTYYLVYTTPFSEITLDAVIPSSGNVYSNNFPMCTSGNMTNLDIGTAGDGKTTKLGGANLNGSAWIIQAKPGSNAVIVTTIGNSQVALAPAMFSKAISKAAPSPAGDAAALSNVMGLLAKLPKNKQTILQKAKKALLAPPATAPTISEMQAVLETKVIPVLADMITKLRVVEGTGFTFTITPAMTGNSETVNTVLDDGEFFALDAGISVLKAFLNVITAYNFDANYDLAGYDPLSIVNGPANGTTTGSPTATSQAFFTLKTSGAASMTSALTSLQEAADKAKLCYLFVFNQWGYTGTPNLSPTKNPNDNGLQWHDDTCPSCFTVTDDNDNRNMLDAIKMALQGQVTLTDKVQGGTETTILSDGTTTITVNSTATTASDNTQTLVVNATKFFSNPVDRTDLPSLGYDLPLDVTLSQLYSEPVFTVVNGVRYSCTIQPTTVFPDPTFNGIFPNGVPDLGNSMQVINGSLEVSLDAIDMTRKIHANVKNPDTVTSMKASVSVDAYSAYGTTPTARLRGVFYNDGTSGGAAGSNVGDIWAGMLISKSVVQYKILRCLDMECDLSTQLSGTTMGAVNLHEQHTLSVAWDPAANIFTFQLDSNTPVTVDSTSLPPVVGTPNRPLKGVGVRIVSSPGLSGNMEAHFDNILINGAPYDNFSDNFPTLNQLKWLIAQ